MKDALHNELRHEFVSQMVNINTSFLFYLKAATGSGKTVSIGMSVL